MLVSNIVHIGMTMIFSNLDSLIFFEKLRTGTLYLTGFLNGA